MDNIERDRLYLTWLSCKDFTSLGLHENQKRLKLLWEHMKSQIEPYFEGYAYPFDTIRGTFKNIHLTIDSKQPCGYDPQRDIMTFNLWSLFFQTTADQNCIPSLPFNTAGQFAHEFDHYQYFHEIKMIGGTTEEYDEFSRSKMKELERRAFLSQIYFLENGKKNLPESLKSYTVKVAEWSKRGIPVMEKFVELIFKRPTCLFMVDGMMTELRQVIEQIDKGSEYNEMCSENTLENMERIIKALNLPIKLDSHKQEYQEVIISI